MAPIPDVAGSLPPRIYHLLLGANSLRGPIPDAVNSLRDLKSFDASQNELSGSIPIALFFRCFPRQAHSPPLQPIDRDFANVEGCDIFHSFWQYVGRKLAQHLTLKPVCA